MARVDLAMKRKGCGTAGVGRLGGRRQGRRAAMVNGARKDVFIKAVKMNSW